MSFLALIDLVICAIICKVCVVPSATTRLLIDKDTSKVYYIQDSLIIGIRVLSTEIVSNDEDGHEVSMRRLPSHYLDSLEDLGWEGHIVSQLITSRRKKSSVSNGLAASEKNLLPNNSDVI